MTSNCERNCAIAAAVTGLFVWASLSGVGDMHPFAGLVLALIAAVLVHATGIWLGCEGREDYEPEPVGLMPPRAEPLPLMPVQVAAPAAPVRDDLPAVAIPVAMAAAMPAEAAVQSVAPVVEKPAKAKKPKKAKEEKPKKAKEKDKKAKKAEKVEKPKKPKKTRALPPDDLQRIKGVGPKLEQTLNEGGVTRFDQIAGWQERDIDRFAEAIGRLGGRIRAEDWVGQAQTLVSSRDEDEEGGRT